MKKLYILGIGMLMMIGCTPTTPPVNIPPAPIKVESASPTMGKVNAGINDTVQANIKLQEKIKEQQKIVADQNATIKDTISKMEDLKRKIEESNPNLTVDTTTILELMKKVESRNLFLEKENTEFEKIIKEQEEILKITRDNALKTYDLLVAKETEANALREQNTFLGQNLNVKNKEVEQLKKDLQSAKISAARSAVYRNWIWGLVGLFLAYTVLKNILMIYFPAIKFRV